MHKPLELFPWNANFETGISSIDQQHRTLVELINELAQHLAIESDSLTLNRIFTKLTDYAIYHFNSEENVWEQHLANYPSFTHHVDEHQKFIETIGDLQKAENDKPLNQNIEDILGFLIHWLIGHILENDMRMAKVVLALQSGSTIEEAEQQAEHQMSNVLRTMIETTRDMYDNLTQLTLTLMREKHVRTGLEKKLQLAATVFDNTLESICITDPNHIIISANPAFYKTSGYSEAEVIGKSLSAIKSGLNDELLSNSIVDSSHKQEHWGQEITSRNKNGELQSEWLSLSSVQNETGDLEYCVGIFSNISQLIQSQQKLERLAHHDPLTGLANRLLLTDRFYSSIANAKRNHENFATCFLDLDGFKPVNDTYTHAAGDIVLCVIAERIKSVLRENDTIARVGGDEFVLLLNNLHAEDNCQQTLDRLLTEISLPIAINEIQQVSVSASIGVANFPKHGTDMIKLLANADQAMYIAKQRGKSQYAYSTNEIS